ncbi:MAG: FAD-binding protein [Neomegalonema sp.]|nr:FAD-binding protein [Neomegalonema sp.]
MTDAPHALAIAELKAILGARLMTGPSVLDLHSTDAAHHAPHRPDAVAFPQSTQEVSQILTICHRHAMPVTPFAIGSSLEGAAIPIEGGLSLDMMQMNRVLTINEADLDAVVQPGVTRKQLNEELRATGLMFTVDPGADASLGGMAATRASGTNTVRYGTMRENVLALEAVMADGTVIRTGTRARKSSAGYDLTKLLIGSEGTLAVITELTVRLFGRPEAMSAATCAFANIDDAVQTVIATIQSQLPVARIELLDATSIDGLNQHSKTDFPLLPHLFLEFHGSTSGAEETARAFGEIAAEFGATDFASATDEAARNRLWSARHDFYWAARALRPEAKAYLTDVCVPISRLAACIAETRGEIEQSGLLAPLVGHVGDGNFHLQIMMDPNEPAQANAARTLAQRLARRALSMGGTISGEHGIGLGKKALMSDEHGAALEVMRAIKQALDPKGILNPGKMLPAAGENGSLPRKSG